MMVFTRLHLKTRAAETLDTVKAVKVMLNRTVKSLRYTFTLPRNMTKLRRPNTMKNNGYLEKSEGILLKMEVSTRIKDRSCLLTIHLMPWRIQSMQGRKLCTCLLLILTKTLLKMISKTNCLKKILSKIFTKMISKRVLMNLKRLSKNQPL